MKDIAIYGVGGFGREIACLIRRLNEKELKWRFVGFFDDNPRNNLFKEYGILLGGCNELNFWETSLNIVIAIGDSFAREKIVSKINNDKIEYPNLTNRFSVANKSDYSIGKGNIILDTYFSCNVNIGDFNVFNSSVVLGHDVSMGNFNTVMPAVKISGEVTIGNNIFFGIGSIILQQLKIGHNVRIGAGSVLLHKPKNNMLYIGNPAKVFKY